MNRKEISMYSEITKDRIKEKQEIIRNNNIIIDYMIKNKIEFFGSDTIKDLQERNQKLQEYINVAIN